MGARRGPKPWDPRQSAIARDMAVKDLIEEAAEARGVGLQSLEEVAANVLRISHDCLFAYLEREPTSDLSVALTRARYRRTAFMKAKASKIAGDDKHQRQADMLKFLLGKLGGDEFAERMELRGNKKAPLFTRDTGAPMNAAEIGKALAALDAATKNRRPRK